MPEWTARSSNWSRSLRWTSVVNIPLKPWWIGSRCGPFPDAIIAIESGKVKLYPLISAEYSIEEGVRAFTHASERGALKVILKFD